jgi:flavodoxin
MKILVLYDSKYGNTQQVAREIANQLPGEIDLKLVGEFDPQEVSDYQLVIMGSPTHGADATDSFKSFFEQLKSEYLQDVQFGVFDTRVTWWFLKLFGYAAPRMAQRIRSLGGTVIGEPAGFIVSGGEGPLAEGELERAQRWALDLQKTAAETFKPETRI